MGFGFEEKEGSRKEGEGERERDSDLVSSPVAELASPLDFGLKSGLLWFRGEREIKEGERER